MVLNSNQIYFLSNKRYINSNNRNCVYWPQFLYTYLHHKHVHLTFLELPWPLLFCTQWLLLCTLHIFTKQLDVHISTCVSSWFVTSVSLDFIWNAWKSKYKPCTNWIYILYNHKICSMIGWKNTAAQCKNEISVLTCTSQYMYNSYKEYTLLFPDPGETAPSRFSRRLSLWPAICYKGKSRIFPGTDSLW